MATPSPREIATKHPYHLIPLGAFAFLAMILTSAMGAVPWIILAVAEAMYQLTAPDSRFVKGLVAQGELETVRSRMEEEKVRTLQGLTDDVQRKFLVLSNLADTISQGVMNQPEELRTVLAPVVPRTAEILRQYLRAAQTVSALQVFLGRNQEETLTKQVAALKVRQTASDVTDPVKAVEAKRLKLVEGRLVKIHAAREKIPLLEAQMETLHEAMCVIYDQVTAPSSGGRVRLDLDGIISDAESDTGAADVREMLDSLADADEDRMTLENTLRGKAGR